MPKRATQLDREIAEALARPCSPRRTHATRAPVRSGSRSFVLLFGAWLKKTRGPELVPLLHDFMRDAVESSARKPARDKLVKKVSGTIVDRLVRFAQGPEFLDWLDDVMEQVGEEAGARAYEALTVNASYVDSEEPFIVSARFVGNSQDPDTEVPAHLSHRDLARVFTKMGGKASCDWRIREVERWTGFGGDPHTVYECRVTFPMKELPTEVYGQKAIEAAADSALIAWKDDDV